MNFNYKILPFAFFGVIVALLIYGQISFSNLRAKAQRRISAQIDSLVSSRDKLGGGFQVTIENPILMLAPPNRLFFQATDFHGLYDVKEERVLIVERKHQTLNSYDGGDSNAQQIIMVYKDGILVDINPSAQNLDGRVGSKSTLKASERRSRTRNERAIEIAEEKIALINSMCRNHGATLVGSEKRVFGEWVLAFNNEIEESRNLIEELRDEGDSMAHTERMSMNYSLLQLHDRFMENMAKHGWKPPVSEQND